MDKPSDTENSHPEETVENRDPSDQEMVSPSAEEASAPQKLHGSDINLNRPKAEASPDENVSADQEAEQVPRAQAEAEMDDSMTHKRAMKVLNLSTDDVMGNLRQLSENRQREVFMHHLLNTEAGKAALDTHVKKRGQDLKRKGIAGKDIYNQVTAKLMAANLEEMQQAFPDVAKTILDERNALNVDEEFAAMRKIEPSIARLDADEKSLKQELREIKQHDNYFLSDSDPKMLQRIISSKLSYAEMQKKPFPYGKVLKGSMFALGGMAAIASGGAPAAALFLATKGTMSMANRMIDKSEAMKVSAGDSLVKSGVVSQQDITKSDQEIAAKAKGGKWKRALALGAVAVGCFALGDAMDGTSKLVDLWEVGKELVSSTPELDDHAYSRTLDALNLVPEGSVLDPEAVGAAVNLAESAADPAAAAAQQAGELVTEGSPLNAESVEAGVEAVTQARDAAPELGPDAVAAGVEAVSEAADQAPVEPVLHDIKPGDTASQIAYDYLKEKGITVTSADLYGSNGILAQTGLDQDLIYAGDTLDLTALDQYAQNLTAGSDMAPEALAEGPSSDAPVAPPAPQDEAVSRFTANLEATRAQGALAHTSETYTQLFGRGIDLPSVSAVGSAPAEALAAMQGEASPVMDEILSVRDDLSSGDLNRSSSLLQEGAVHDLMDNAVGEVMGNGLEDVESGPQGDGQTPEADEELAERQERDDTPGMG